MDIFGFLASDTALILAIGIMAYCILQITMIEGPTHGFEFFFPISLYFLKPFLDIVLNLAFFGAVLWIALPFVVGIGFPFIYSLIIGLTFVFKKAFSTTIEYGLILSLLFVVTMGSFL